MSALSNLLSNNKFRYGDTISFEDIEKHREVITVSKSDLMQTSTPSAGNQMKWYKDNMYIKLDSFGAENLAEIVSCWLMQFIHPLCDWVKYYPCEIIEDGIFVGDGCYSYSYLKDNEFELTFGKLLNNTFNPFSISYDDIKMLLYDIFGNTFEDYIDDILFVDILIRNGDRHFYNMALRCSNECVDTSPIYDNGAALLSNVVRYPIEADINVCLNNCLSRPFSLKFEHPNIYFKKKYLDYNKILNGVVYGRNKYFNRMLDILMICINDTRGVLWND